jgi:hypothetical protein
MKKNKFILKLIYIIVPALMLVMSSFSGCEKQNIQGTGAQENWIWSQDGVTVRLNLYQSESKFYSIVEEETTEHLNIFFQNDTWTYYKMVGDTMYVILENETFPTESDRYNKWLILQYNEQNFEMEYVGTLPTIPTAIIKYLFNHQN